MMDLRFTFERWLLRGLHYRLIFAAAIISLVSLLAGLLVFVLDPGFEDAGDAVWWSFLRLSDPGYLGDDEGVVSVTISTVVTVLGYVLFLGLLVAILTQWMNTLIERVEAGATSVTFKNHIVVLGWHDTTASIVCELLQTRGRVSRFLEDSGAHSLRVVVLAENVDAELREQLKSRLGARWDDRRVVLRSGSPLKLEGLERVAFHDAASVILPGADFTAALPGVGDSEVIKTLASIFKAGKHAGHTPLAVAALYNANRGNVARRAYKGELEIIAADQLVSRILAQCTLHPGLWSVYWELFSLNEDNALIVRKLASDHVTDIGQARNACPNAAVIGVIPAKARSPILNPPGDMRIKSDDALIFIAKSYADCSFSDGVAPISPEETPDWRIVPSSIETVLIAGWNRKVPKILDELLSYGRKKLSVDVVGSVPIHEREAATQSLIDAQRAGKVREIEANFMNPDVAAEIHPEEYDAVLMVARERLGDEAIADAATISAFLTLNTLLAEAGKPHIVAEILEEENAGLIDGEEVDAVVSPMIISYILSQVALEPELGSIFEELTQPWGTTILFRLFESENADTEVSFAELAAQAAMREETAIGVVISNPDGDRTCLNPGAGACWSSDEIQQVIVLGTVARPESQTGTHLQ